jgi:hypothetical protein
MHNITKYPKIFFIILKYKTTFTLDISIISYRFRIAKNYIQSS